MPANNPPANQSTLDEISQKRQQHKDRYNRPGSEYRTSLEQTTIPILGNFLTGGGPALDQGLGNLLDILRGQGRTDPQAFNRSLVDIQRGTQGQQQQAQQSMAQSGMQQSGVGQAIQAAIGQGGENRRGAAVANENAMAEQRQREDLRLLLDMLINPGNELFATVGDLNFRDRERRSENNRNKRSAYAGAVSGTVGSFVG